MQRFLLTVILTVILTAVLSCSSEQDAQPRRGPSAATIAACERNCDTLADSQRPECERGVIAADSCKRAIELATQDCKRICKPGE